MRHWLLLLVFFATPTWAGSFFSDEAKASAACEAYRASKGYQGWCYQNRDSSTTWFFYMSNESSQQWPYYVDSRAGKCPTGQVADSSGKCSTPPPPTCKSGEKVDAATNKCVPECPLRQSKDSSGACVADVPPVAGSLVPSNGPSSSNSSLGSPGHVGWNDPTQTQKKNWGGGISCIGGWEYQYAGGLCVASSGASDTEMNCVNYDAKYTGKTCGAETTDTPTSGGPSVPGSTGGTACDPGYSQGTITINGTTTITCTPTTINPGTNPSPGSGSGTTPDPNSTTCGGLNQPPCSVSIKEPFSVLPGMSIDPFVGFESAAAGQKNLIEQIGSGGDVNGLLSWAFLPSVPSYNCSDPSLSTPGHIVSFSGWCEKMGMIRDLLAFAAYILTLYGLFHVVSTSSGGKS